jgi:hypothetical protein
MVGGNIFRLIPGVNKNFVAHISGSISETEQLVKFVNAEVLLMPFPLRHPKDAPMAQTVCLSSQESQASQGLVMRRRAGP